MTTGKTIPEYPNYKVTEGGRIWSSQSAIFLRPRLINGHPVVTLAKKTYLIRRLVLETYAGPCPNGATAKNLNGNKVDNRFENLMWISCSKEPPLTAGQEEEIVKLWEQNPEKWTVGLFCECFNVTKEQIRDLLGDVE